MSSPTASRPTSARHRSGHDDRDLLRRLARVPRRLVLLVLGAALLVGAVATTAVALAGAGASDKLTWDWSMPDRFGSLDKQGRIAYLSSPEYLDPSSWKVDLNACNAPAVKDRGPDTKIVWTFSGGALGSEVKSTTAGCRYTQTLPELGAYDVTAKLLSETAVVKRGTVTLKDVFIVSVGDSVASGEGNPDLVKPGKLGNSPIPSLQPVWELARCDRSALAGPAQAALRLEQRDPKSSVTFLHLACSGATVTAGLLGDYAGQHTTEGEAPIPNQLDTAIALAHGRAIDTMTMSIGANDMGFADIVKTCMGLAHCDTDTVPGVENGTQIYTKGLAKLPGLYSQVDQRLDGYRAPDGTRLIDNVLLSEYFDISQNDTGAYCNATPIPGFPGTNDGFSAAEMQWTHDVVSPKLNAAVKAGADAANAANQGPGGKAGPQWTFVTGIADAFAEHGYCAKDRWVRTLVESFAYQHGYDGGFHPNTEGHLYGYAKAIEAQAVRVNGFGGVTQPFAENPAIDQSAAGITDFLRFLDDADAMEAIRANIPFHGGKWATDTWQGLFAAVNYVQGKVTEIANGASKGIYAFDEALDDVDANGDSAHDFAGGPGFAFDFDVDIEPKVPSPSYDLTVQLKATVDQKRDFAWAADGLDFLTKAGASSNGVLFDIEKTIRVDAGVVKGLQLPVGGPPVARLGVPVNATFNDLAADKPGANPLSFKAGLLTVAATGTVQADIGAAVAIDSKWDTDRNGVVDKAELDQTDLAHLFSVSCVSKGATVDLTGKAALAGLQAEVATIALRDADLCNGIDPPTVQLGGIGDLRTLTLADLVNGLAQVTQSLQAAQAAGDLDLPLVEEPLSKAVKVTDRLVQFFVDNGFTDPANPMNAITVDPANTSVTDLASFAGKLACALNPPANGSPCVVDRLTHALNMRYSNGKLLFDVDRRNVAVTGAPKGTLDLGDTLGTHGVSDVKGAVAVDVAPTYSLGFGFGVDLAPGLPLADRFFVTSGLPGGALFTLDAAVEADVDVTASISVVDARLRDGANGPVTLLQRRDPLTPMVSVGLTDTDGDHVVKLSELSALTQGPSPLTVRIGAAVPATTLGVTLDLLGKPVAGGTLTVSWPDVTDPAGLRVDGDAAFDAVSLPFAYDPDNPRAVVTQVLTAARETITRLRQQIATGAGPTTKALPFVGRSVADLEPVLAKLQGSLDRLLEADDLLTLPKLEEAIDKALVAALGGSAASTGLVHLAYVPAAEVGGQAAVRAELTLGVCTEDRTATGGCTTTRDPVAVPFSVDLGGTSPGATLAETLGAGAAGSAVLSYDARATLAVGVLLPKVTVGTTPGARPVVDPATPWGVFVEDTTGVEVALGAKVNARLEATLFAQTVRVGFGAEKATADLRVRFGLVKPTAPSGERYLVSTPAFGAFLASLLPADLADVTDTRAGTRITCGDPGVVVDACARLPISLNGAPLGTVTVTVGDVFRPASWSIQGVDAIIARLSDEVVQFKVVVAGVRQLAQSLQASLRAMPAGTRLPLLGTDATAGADVVARFDDRVLTPLNTLATQLQTLPTASAAQAAAEAFLSDRNRFPALVPGGRATVTVTCKQADGTVGACAAGDSLARLQSFEVTKLPIGFAVSATTPKLDLGFPGLRLTSDRGVTASADLVLSLAFGIDRTLGFYVPAGTKTAPGPAEVSLQVAASLPPTVNGELAFLPIEIKDETRNTPDLTAGFGLNLFTTRPDGRLPIGELATAQFVPSMSVTSAIAMRIRTLPMSGKALSALPELSATLKIAGGLTWTGTGPVEPQFAISFDTVQLDGGSVVKKFLVPVAKQLREFTRPLEPAVAAIQKPIPGAAEAAALTGQTAPTWLQLFKLSDQIFGGGRNRDGTTMIDNLITLVDVVKKIDQAGDAQGVVDLGSFEVLSTVAANPVPGGDAGKLLGATKVTRGPDGSEDVLSRLGFVGKENVQRATATGALRFPVFDKPVLLFQLLLGKDVPLVTYDAGKLSTSASVTLSYPVGPVTLSLAGSATLSGHFAAGFDTYGIRKAVELTNDDDPTNDGWWDLAQGVLSGFYVDDFDAAGNDVPEVRFDAQLTAGVSVGAFGFAAGAEGGVRGEVTIDLATEPQQHGKVRWPDVARQLAANPDPLCFFGASAKISAFVQVYVEAPFGRKDIPVADTTLWQQDDLLAFCRQNLTDAPNEQPPPPPVDHVASMDAAGRLTVNATDGDDDIWVELADFATGGVSVSGPLGNHLYRGVTSIRLDLGPGDDALRMNTDLETEVPVTVCGGAGDDSLDIGNGTGPSQVFGDGGDGCAAVPSDQAGDDRLVGGRRGDLLDGGPGADVLWGGRGGDTLLGGPGNDTVRGQTGDDDLDGGPDRDTLDLGDAVVDVHFTATEAGPVDEADTETGFEDLVLGRGSDVVDLTAHPFGLVSAGAGSDTVELGANTVLVFGGTDADTVVGGTGQASVTGGDGDDVFVDGPGAQWVTGDAGHDTVDYSDSPVGVSVTLDGEADDGPRGTGHDDVVDAEVVVGSDHDDRLVAAASAGTTLRGGDGSDVLVGGNGDDTLEGGAGGDDLDGGGDHDALLGGAGDDRLHGGPGGDTFAGGADKDTADYSDRTEALFITKGDTRGDGTKNTFRGSLEGDDVQADVERIVGGSGDDELYGSTTADEILGGPGADTVSGGPDDGDVLEGGADVLDGGPGGDRVCDTVHNGCNEGNTGDTSADVLRGGDGEDGLYGAGGTDTFDGGRDKDVLIGGSGGDTITGGDGDDTVRGLGGGDTIDGGAGADALDGGPGADTIRGGTAGHGDGTITGGSGTDTIYADSEGSVIHTGDDASPDTNANTVYGSPAADTIHGDNGPDTVNAGKGNDTVFGFGGNDVIDLGDGRDTGQGDGTGGDAGDTFCPVGVAHVCDDVIRGGKGVDTLLGGAGKDVLDGGVDDDDAYGGNDDDTLIGGPGDDSLAGGTGDDLLDGGAGGDRLRGLDNRDGNAADLVEPGSRDTVSYAGRTEPVTVRGDGPGNGGASDVSTGRFGSDVLYGDVERYVLGTVADTATLGSRAQVNPVTVEGGDGDDQLTVTPGLGQPVRFVGGAGADTLDEGTVRNGATTFEGGPGRDTVTYRRTDGVVFVSRDGVANDGGAGERDDVRADVEVVKGAREGVPPTPLVTVPAAVAVAEGAGVVKVKVTLSAPTWRDVTVSWTTANGTAKAGADYVAVTGTVTIAAGRTSAVVTVRIRDDAVAEPAEAFTVSVTAAVNGTPGTPRVATVRIGDDD